MTHNEPMNLSESQPRRSALRQGLMLGVLSLGLLSAFIPVATGCQKGETPKRLRPFATTPRRKTPTIVPVIRPRPPPSGAPPTITAAMAVSSYPNAACGVALAV